MSHELRTPLNSLLVLAEQLEDNPDGNLTARQVQYASVIRSSGGDLLKLLNDILDLAKVESKTVQFELSELSLVELRDSMVQSFHPVADGQGLAFSADLDGALPATIVTDPHRLRQVLMNLLSNAFKFTETGEVALRLELGRGLEPGQRAARERRLGASRSASAIPASGSRRSCRRRCSRPSPRRTARPRASTAAPGSGSRSAATSSACSAARSRCRASPGVGSTFTVYLPLETAERRGRHQPRRIRGGRHRRDRPERQGRSSSPSRRARTDRSRPEASLRPASRSTGGQPPAPRC